MTPRFRRVALTAAVLPLAMLIGLRSAWAAYACRMDGEVRTSCCCPKKEAERGRPPADHGPRMVASSCCDVTISESPAAPQVRETERLEASDAPLALVAWTIDIAAIASIGRRTTRHAFARPPPASVPTYLANRTILR